MANWCESDLKIRGTKENIERFLLEGLESVGTFEREAINTTVNKLKYGITITTYSGACEIDCEGLAKLSKEFLIDSKIYGFECGMQFNQDVESIGDEIIKNEKIKFEN